MKHSQVLETLKNGEIELAGQFTWGSNYTFLANVSKGDERLEAVYKPTRGERPLWDFPAETLAGREVAAYLVSEALGWELVPPTILRSEGPHGSGSLQLRVSHNPDLHYFTFDEAIRQQLRPAALFDLVINNADRKGGHILLGDGAKIWLIDHGICFHSEPKLRTVIWDFAGEKIPSQLIDDLQRLCDELKKDGQLSEQLRLYLTGDEIKGLVERNAQLIVKRGFPAPPEERAIPWPMV